MLLLDGMEKSFAKRCLDAFYLCMALHWFRLEAGAGVGLGGWERFGSRQAGLGKAGAEEAND